MFSPKRLCFELVVTLQHEGAFVRKRLRVDRPLSLLKILQASPSTKSSTSLFLTTEALVHLTEVLNCSADTVREQGGDAVIEYLRGADPL